MCLYFLRRKTDRSEEKSKKIFYIVVITFNMIPFTEVAVLDRNAEYRGVPNIKLMESAGRGLADVIRERYGEGNHRVLFVCGTGNNGGDGYVAARYLSGWFGRDNITVYLIKGREHVRSKIANKNLERLECSIVEDFDWDDIDEHIIVDGILGTGISGSVREPYRSVIQNINDTGNEVVSIDVPSGLGADIQVEPGVTVTFHDKKYGMNEDNCGEIIVKDIGIPNEAELYTGPGELVLFPIPHEESHKGNNGSLLIVGGGPFTGAPALSALGAYRAGVDLVHLAVPSKVSDVVSSYSPSFIVHPLEGERLKKEHVERVIDISNACDAVLIGPGLGSDPDTMEAVVELLRKLEKPLVVDADALRAFKNNKFDLSNGCVITPHHGELKEIEEDCSDLSRCADELAGEMDITVLLKGRTDYITDGKKHKWNDFGNAGMTVGGTGDTLAGVIGSLLARDMTPFDAARSGAYITCRAGEIAFEEKRCGMLPTDISESIPEVLKEI